MDDLQIARRYYDDAQPFYPLGFSVVHRNPGHWDIFSRECPGRVSAFLEANPGSYTSARDGDRERAFRIRGEPDAVIVYDERWNPHKPHPRDELSFATVAHAMAWIAAELMGEPSANRTRK